MPPARNDALIAQKALDPACVARFWGNVALAGSDACWLWQKAVNSGGYGVFTLESRAIVAHRFAYISAYGAIREDMLKVVQSCRDRACQNPRHLEGRLPYMMGKPSRAQDRRANDRRRLAMNVIRSLRRKTA